MNGTSNRTTAHLLVGLDIGGSFTDLVLYHAGTGETRYRKASNRAGDLLESVRECLAELDVPWADVASVKHGTTVVINTIIERRGVRTALLTTEGFRDVLEIGRTNWPEPYNLHYDRLPPLVGRYAFTDSFTTPIRPAKHGDSSGVRGAAWLWPLEK